MNSTALAQTDEKTPHWNAKLYRENSIKLQKNTALELIRRISSKIKDDDYILDIGCGDGKITVEIAQYVSNGFIEAIDLSDSMIALAQSEYQDTTNIKFSIMNAENLSFDKEFDWIMSFFCIQWVRNKEKTFKKIAELLLPTGKMALIMANRNQYILKARRKLFSEQKWFQYFRSYEDVTDVIDDDDYEFYAHKVGLRNIKYREHPKTLFLVHDTFA